MLVELALDIAAVHRLTRLATEDTITRPARDAAIRDAYRRAGRDELELKIRRAGVGLDAEPVDVTEFVLEDPSPPFVAGVLTCRWCASVWIAAGVVAARRLAPSLWAPAARLLALSSASTLLARLED